MHPFDSPPEPLNLSWTPARQTKFLALLAERGNVRNCAARCGLSAQSAYKLRRRDALFARSWDAALLLARDHSQQVLADRALDGIEEPVFYRGEQVGTRRKYDTRLLLAHLARLDAHADSAQRSGADADAARFDELLALVAGEEVPDELPGENGDDLPKPRDVMLDELVQSLRGEMYKDVPAAIDEDEEAEHIDRINAAVASAWIEAADRWDDWFDQACARVDAAERQPAPRIALGSPVLARPGLKAFSLASVSSAGLIAAEIAAQQGKWRGTVPAAAPPKSAPFASAARCDRPRKRRIG